MATISIRRGEPFQRGDLMIQIRIDGEKAGTLIGEQELRLAVPPGMHEIQATMFGLRGKKRILQVDRETDTRIEIIGTRVAKQSTWLPSLSVVLTWFAFDPFWLWIVTNFVLLILMYYYRQKQRNRQEETLLRLSVVNEAALNDQN